MEKRLGFVMNFPPATGYAWDTIEAVFGEVARLLRPRGYEVSAAFPSGDVRLARTLLDAGIDVQLVDYDPTRSGSTGLANLVRWIQSRRIAILYLTDQPTYHRRYLRLRLAGVRRIIVHDRTSGIRRPRPGVAALVKRVANRLPLISADRFLGVSKFVTDRLRRVNGTPASRTQTVYNGIDLSRFDNLESGVLRRELGLDSATPIIFASGRAMPYKGIPVLLRAVRRLCDDGWQNLHLVYAGNGPALASFRTEATDLGLAKVHFLGKRTDVPALLADATIAVIPSVWAEAFGLTVVEAMAAGVPLVATRIGGIPELVEPGVTGLLVEPNDAAGLAAAIGRLLGDAELRENLAAKARVWARERFSLTRVGSDLASAIETTIGR
ncbi:MAG TPA: glycosyltransferase family 4 protein [Gemmatimonadales bacterium]|nr:glycosyltransferase family 4 protein [Gemmatimonadales bacterium]